MSLKRINRYSVRIRQILLHGFILLVLAGLIVASCQKNDGDPPIMTMNGADTLFQVLNAEYKDPGVTAVDETDGNISVNVYVDNPVDINRVGEYTIIYRVVDKAGNEAAPLSRVVYVYNEGLAYYGDYSVKDIQVYPGQTECNYPSYIWIDSTLNFRLVLLDFACNSQRTVYVDVADTLVIMPFQWIQDSVYNMALHGAGTISDSMVTLQYTRIEPNLTSYWDVTFTRLK